MQLPSGAQTWLSCGYDNAWTLQEYLMAHMVDALRAANWQRAGNDKAPPPEPVRRPSDIREAGATNERRREQALLQARRRAHQLNPEGA